MKTVKLIVSRIFGSRYLRARILLFGFFLVMISGYSNENIEFVDKNEFLKFADSSSNPMGNPKFTKKFNSLVARAYFKLIVEAERADIRLVNEYKRLYAKNELKMDDLDVQEEFTLVYKRFLTHRRMLSGLKSWRIFSEDRTGDLEYFKKEYHDAVYKMYRDKSSDDKMVAFLMYRLADLYHLP